MQESFVETIEKAVVDIVQSYGQSSALGTEEQQLVAAVLKAYQSKSVLDLVPVIADALAVVASLKARAQTAEAAHAAVYASQPIGGPNQEQSA